MVNYFTCGLNYIKAVNMPLTTGRIEKLVAVAIALLPSPNRAPSACTSTRVNTNLLGLHAPATEPGLRRNFKVNLPVLQIGRFFSEKLNRNWKAPICFGGRIDLTEKKSGLGVFVSKVTLTLCRPLIGQAAFVWQSTFPFLVPTMTAVCGENETQR